MEASGRAQDPVSWWSHQDNTIGYPLAFGVLRTVWPGMVSLTRDLGRVLVELAMSRGKPLSGVEVGEEHRTISNPGVRRLAGI